MGCSLVMAMVSSTMVSSLGTNTSMLASSLGVISSMLVSCLGMLISSVVVSSWVVISSLLGMKLRLHEADHGPALRVAAKYVVTSRVMN